jgi:polysaccharide transporter, PST family
LINIREKAHHFYSHSDFKLLFINFTNFGIYQIINYIVPLITIPYIVRIIGPEKFGMISLAQALAYYFSVIAEYGYGVSGVQYIAQNQKDYLKCSEIVKNIYIIQFILMTICYLLLMIIVEFYQPFTLYKDIFQYSFLTVPANILLSLWFYLGIEKIKYINYVTFTSRLLYILAIFIFINKVNDYYLIPLLNSISYLIAAMYSLYLLVKKFGIKFDKTIPIKINTYLNRDKSMFMSLFFMNLFRNSNILILGLVAPESSVGFYSAGEKIIKAIQGVFTPITQVLYPYVSRIKTSSRDRSMIFLKKLIVIMACCSAMITFMIVFLSGTISLFIFGPGFESASRVISIASGVIFFGVINYILGIIFMTNYSLKNEFAKSVIITGIVNIISCFMLSYYFYETGAAISFATSELVLLLAMFYYIFKTKNVWSTKSIA